LLERGAHVVGLVRDEVGGSELLRGGRHPRLDLVRGCVEDGALVERTLAEYEVQTVLHLAAQTIVGTANKSPASTFESNIRGTWTLLEACRLHGVQRVVVAASDKAYGPHDHLPYTEDSALQPVFPYDVSKAATDLIARSYWHTYGLPVAVTRFANLYGGGDRNFSRLIPETVTAVLDGRRPIIRSDGSPERDFLYVEDAAGAYLAIADALGGEGVAGEAFNAGSGRPHAVREVVELICELGPTDIEPDYRGTGNPSGEIDRQYLDATKIRERIGWEPEVDLREGLATTVEWYGAHPEVRPATVPGS
jgi:CDP-glucose 4,6-dehydratase